MCGRSIKMYLLQSEDGMYWRKHSTAEVIHQSPQIYAQNTYAIPLWIAECRLLHYTRSHFAPKIIPTNHNLITIREFISSF